MNKIFGKVLIAGFVLSLVHGAATASTLSDALGVDWDIAGGGTLQVGASDPVGAIQRLPGTIVSTFESLPGEMTGLAAAIRHARSRAAANSYPIPPHIRSQLTGFVSESTLNRVRYSLDWGAAQNGTLHQFILGNGYAQAITLDNIVVFRDNQGANDVDLWAHELQHVEQYERMGLESFASRCVQAYWTIENEAKDNSARLMAAVRARQYQQYPQYPSNGYGYNVAAMPPPATYCSTPSGNYPMYARVPQGASCYVPTYWGPIYGIAR